MCCAIYYIYFKIRKFLNNRKFEKERTEYKENQILYNLKQLQNYNNKRRYNPSLVIFENRL